jgi:hypothetical protein
MNAFHIDRRRRQGVGQADSCRAVVERQACRLFRDIDVDRRSTEYGCGNQS